MHHNESRARDRREASSRLGLFRLTAPLLLAAFVAAAGAACNNAGASDPTPVVHFKITPASGTYATASSATPTVAAIESPSAAGNALTLVGLNTKFDETALTAAPGAVTIGFSNKDGGVPHNLHVFAGAGAGEDMQIVRYAAILVTEADGDRARRRSERSLVELRVQPDQRERVPRSGGALDRRDRWRR